MRFQVSPAHADGGDHPLLHAPDAQQILPAYEQAMLREVERICEAIPHEDLAIQWDVCIEMVTWDGRWPLASRSRAWTHVFGADFRPTRRRGP